MASNQRRPGFRLPWASETDAAAADEAAEADSARAGNTPTTERQAPQTDDPLPRPTAEPAPPMTSDQTHLAGATAMQGTPAAEAPARGANEFARGARPDPASGFMRDLVAAMRRVAEETRQSSLSDLRTRAEERVRTLEAESERRREALSAQAEADGAGVGDWARAETERIRQEAEARVAARRAQLDQQLAAESARSEAEAAAVRERVAEYERELDAYHAQLSDIADPAEFAAAARRMPSPPTLTPTPPAPRATTPAAAESTNGTPFVPPVPAGEEVLASRLAELDASLPPQDPDPSATQPPSGEGRQEAGIGSTSTEIVVKGLGSFGAITGFRQALASVDGVEGVSLSLGPTGEFVFRAAHAAGFDVASAITALEGDAAKIERHADGGLRVTVDRGR